MALQDREDKIRNRAHSLWEAAGCPEGQPEHFWLEAQRQIDNGKNDVMEDVGSNTDAMLQRARIEGIDGT